MDDVGVVDVVVDGAAPAGPVARVAATATAAVSETIERKKPETRMLPSVTNESIDGKLHH